MNFYFSFFFLVLILFGCNKQHEISQTFENKTTTDDLIQLTNTEAGLGYYKSSIVVMENIGIYQAWIHIPVAINKSLNSIDKSTEMLIEIDCFKREIRKIKTTDSSGNVILALQDDKWDKPPPTTDSYKLIIAICKGKIRGLSGSEEL